MDDFFDRVSITSSFFKTKLALYKEFHLRQLAEWGYTPPEVYVNYVLWLYHPDSPYLKDMDIEKAKQACANRAQLPKEKRKAIFAHEDIVVMEMIDRLLRQVHAHKYALYISTRMAFYSLLHQIAYVPVNEVDYSKAMQDGNNRANLILKIPKIQEELNKLEEEIFGKKFGSDAAKLIEPIVKRKNSVAAAFAKEDLSQY